MPRPSPVRDAIRKRVLDGSRHGWAVDELHLDLESAGIPADYSTVFRALVWLEEQGVAQRVDLGDGKVRYEPAGRHHEHVQCERCGQVREVPDCLVDDASAEIERSTGFRLLSHHLTLSGICPTCQTRADSA